MGLFRTLWIDLTCANCYAVQRQDVQFKTGDDYLQEYQVGQEVDDPVLPPGSEFSGCAPWYCNRCEARSDSECFDAYREVVAEMASEEKLTVWRDGRWDDRLHRPGGFN